MTPYFEQYYRVRYTEELRQAAGNFVTRDFPPFYSDEIFSLLFVDRFSELKWRSDARYFLISNIRSMVVEPYLFSQRSDFESPDQDEFVAALEADVATLIRSSETISASRERGYVSSTSVAQAIGEHAESLKTSSFQFWGE